MHLKPIAAPTLLGLLCGALLLQLPRAVADRTSSYDFFDPAIDVRHILSQDFVDPQRIDEVKMREAMIDGMIEALDDPYTVYVPKQDVAAFEKDLRGRYVGIGCEVNIVDGLLTIVSPMDGSPALQAGIMAGDVVLEIEGQPTLNRDIEKCIEMLMGEPGTPVRIKVRHLDGQEQDYTLTRSQIVTRTVRGIRRGGDSGQWNYCVDEKRGLAYVRITQFNESTTAELTEALDQIQSRGLNGLILDVRDNPGGSLTTAVEVSDLFLESGDVVTIKPRPGRGEEKTFSAIAPGTLPNFPMLVMVNGQSASASEIVSGALQANGRAKVLGTRTFGKGSVQEVRDLDFDRGQLKLTTAHYYLSNGRNINRASDSQTWGVDPDPGMVVAISDDDYIELHRARRDYEIIRAGNGSTACTDAAWIRSNLKDEQLAKAVEALAHRLDKGDWPTVSEDEPAVAAFDLELKRATERRGNLLEALAAVEDRIAELHGLAAEAGQPPLLPQDISLAGGTIIVRDKHGNEVGRFRIEAGNLELALDTMDLTPILESDGK